MGVKKCTLGGSKGYLSGICMANLKVPPSYGVPCAPSIAFTKEISTLM